MSEEGKNKMSNILKFDFQGQHVSFDRNGWINATEAAAKFDKEVYEWLRLPTTKSYMLALARALGYQSKPEKSRFGLVKTVRGGIMPGTWLHPKLEVVFARWLSDEFAIQCDLYIDAILFGDMTVYDQYQNACDRLTAAQKEASKCGKELAAFCWQKPELIHSVGYWHEQLTLPFVVAK